MNAYGTINVFSLSGNQAFEAIYQPSYRHNAQRLGSFDTEGGAILAIHRAADSDGTNVTIQAGKYPAGTRKRGEIIDFMAAFK
jgi:hypothetical protein